MQTYWDYEPKERAEMAEDAVRSLLDVELMEKGVVKVEPPKLRETIPVRDIRKVKVSVVKAEVRYGVGDTYAFKSVEDAQAFIDLGPMDITTEYEWGKDLEHAKPLGNCVIEQREMLDYNDLFAKQKVLRENKAIADANDKAQSEYKEAAKKMDEVLNAVWEDWWNCKEMKRKHLKVKSTFDEYLKMTNGDGGLAEKFILKAFSMDEITEAREWLGDDSIPNVTVKAKKQDEPEEEACQVS